MCATSLPKRPESCWNSRCGSSGWPAHERVRKGGGIDGAIPTRCREAAGAGGRSSRPSARCAVAERGNRMSEFGKVAVLMGGPSSEREISFLSGNAVLAALKARGIDAHAFDPANEPLLDLRRLGFDRVFIALHGRFGEDGTVQGA